MGKAAPGFSLRARDGALFSLSDVAYPGPERSYSPKRVLVMDFFRTDCKPCRASLPKLVELHRKFGKRGVKVMLVALLEDDRGQQKLDAFLARARVPFSVVVDAYGVAGRKYVKKGSGLSIPALFVVDKAGIVRAHLRGLDMAGMRKLEPLLARLAKGT